MPHQNSAVLLRLFAADLETEGVLETPAAAVGLAAAKADFTARTDVLCRALTVATGWEFRFAEGPAPAADPLLEWSAPVNPGVGAALGHLRMDRLTDSNPRASREDRDRAERNEHLGCIPAAAAQQLAAQMIELLSECARLQHALGEREAELAAGAPIVVHPRPATHLAGRLEAVLRGGAQSLGCNAAAMYLLDDDTTELKMRAQWGLGAQRLAEPGRPLASELADLEALSGHAVVLEDDVLMELWHVPEPAGAAVCVPISGPTTVLGTLWLFCDTPRRFTETDTNLAEILAGRLAADLEREALVGQLQARRRGTNKV